MDNLTDALIEDLRVTCCEQKEDQFNDDEKEIYLDRVFEAMSDIFIEIINERG